MRLLISATALLIACFIVWLGSIIYTDYSTFDADEADHATPAIELYNAIAKADPYAVYQAIVRQSFYPPVHSIAVTSSYFIFTPSLFSTRLPSLVSFALTIIVLALTTRRFLALLPGLNPSAGALAAAVLAALSPIAVHNSVLCMLEPLSLLLISLLLLVFVRLDQLHHSSVSLAVGIAAISFVVLLEKYSSGIPVLAAVGSTALILALQKRISIKHLLILGLTTAGPLSIWWLIANRKCIIAYVSDQPSYQQGILSWENLLFEPTAFFTSHVAHPVIGIAALVLAVTAAVKFHRYAAVQLSIAIIFWGLLVMFLSTNNGSRHTMFITPLIWFLSAIGFSFFLKSIPKNLQAICSLVLVSLILVLSLKWLFGLPVVLAKRFEANPLHYHLTENILSELSPDRPVLIRGYTDAYSLEYIRWAAARRWRLPYTAIKIDGFPLKVSFMQRCRRTVSPLIEPRHRRRVGLAAALESGYYDMFIDLIPGAQKPHNYEKRTGRRFYRSWCAIGYKANDLSSSLWSMTAKGLQQPTWCRRGINKSKSPKSKSLLNRGASGQKRKKPGKSLLRKPKRSLYS